MEKSKSKNLTEGTLWDRILIFALPLALTGILQQLFNATDIAVVGNFVGSTAMAAVGANTPLVNLFINFFNGISLGANVVIADAIGRNNKDRVSKAIHTAILLSIAGGVLILILGETLAKYILSLMSVPSDVIDMASLYLKIYSLGMPVIILYNFLAAIFRSMGDTRTPLFALIFGGISNVFFNIFFVVVCHMTVDGVALGTVISNAVSSIILLVKLSGAEEPYKFHFSMLRYDTSSLKSMLSIGVPSGVQGMVFSLSNIIVQSAINSLGSDVMAGSSAAFNVEIMGYFILNSFGQACTTFTAQNNGAGKQDRCKKSLFWAIMLGYAFTIAFCAISLVFSHSILSLFSADENVINVGITRMSYIYIGYLFSVLQETLTGFLRGYGYSLVPAICVLVGVCGTRILWVHSYFWLHTTFASLVMVYPVSLSITASAVFLTLLYYLSKRKIGGVNNN